MQQAAAFFDVDETLINIKSMFDFFDFWCKENNEPIKLHKYMANFQSEVKKGIPREHLNREYYRQFAVSVIRRLKRLVKNGSDLS